MPFPPGAKAGCFCMDEIIGRAVSIFGFLFLVLR
jgi:hypothetical protein